MLYATTLVAGSSVLCYAALQLAEAREMSCVKKLMATVQLYVQMDKNLGQAGELGPLLLTFTDDAAGAPTAPVEGAVAGAGKVPPLAI